MHSLGSISAIASEKKYISVTNVSWDIFHKREESFTSEVLDNH
jgi:hypothetical protein